MIEKPVRSPIVPPIAERISTNLAAWSLVTLSKVDVSNSIFTNFNSGRTSSKSKHYMYVDIQKFDKLITFWIQVVKTFIFPIFLWQIFNQILKFCIFWKFWFEKWIFNIYANNTYSMMLEKLVKMFYIYLHITVLKFPFAFCKHCPFFGLNPCSFQCFPYHNLIFVIQNILEGNCPHQYLFQMHISCLQENKEKPYQKTNENRTEILKNIKKKYLLCNSQI